MTQPRKLTEHHLRELAESAEHDGDLLEDDCELLFGHIAWLDSELERKSTDLEKYGEHTTLCKIYDHRVGNEEPICTCGLWEAMK